MRARHGDVPLDRDASGRYLPWLVAVMVYLAGLALVCAMMMNRAVAHWEQGLTGQLTIQVPRDEAAHPARAAPAKLERLIEMLRRTPGVCDAQEMTPDEIGRLLEPWLGTAARSANLPVPALIAVTLESRAEIDMDALAARVAEAMPGAVLDDHQAWLGRLRDLARSVQLVAALVVALVGGCAVMIVVFATRMGLSVHGHVIELLHLIGALDSYVARQFQAQALKLALRGGVFGLLAAVATVVLVERTLAGTKTMILPDISIRPLEISLLALLPVIIALIAMMTARLTVLRTLGRMP